MLLFSKSSFQNYQKCMGTYTLELTNILSRKFKKSKIEIELNVEFRYDVMK